MLPELGNYALMLALALALVQGVLPLAGAARGAARWMAVARPAAGAQFVLVTLAGGLLVHAFVVNDFSVLYVAQNSNSLLPWYYRVTATWGGHEGSLLLWTWMLSAWTLAVALRSSQLPATFVARVLGVLGLISVGFLLFMLLTSNPFARLLPAALDGRDLNPLLQDAGMIVHPPLLYMGYVGFSVAFAFAIAALLAGQLDATWARWSRPWTLLAWSFLTLGILMGSFWAYYELGWGGWWFWDAVENASFMPWLVGSALLHSLIVSEKRGTFKNWTVLLAILAFSLALLGTFIVRSGVLTSVHAFATDPRRGTFILVFLTLVIGSSLLLYAWRAPAIGGGGRIGLFSREALLLTNNVGLVVAAATVLLGTLYPLVLDALNLGKISVGPPYFEAVFVPLMIPVLLLAALAPFVPWKSARLPAVLREVRWVALAAFFAAVAGGVAAGAKPLVVLGLACALWLVAGTLWQALARLGKGAAGTSLVRRVTREPRSYWGMVVAHAGLGIFVAGVTLVKGFEEARDVNLGAGQSVALAGYTFTLTGLTNADGPNYTAERAAFSVTSAGRAIATLAPEKRWYPVQQTAMTEAAIDRGATRDLYVSLGERTAPGRWLVRVQVKPFVGWIWAGALLIATGGFLAAADRRYRLRQAATLPAVDVPAPALAAGR
ncbi:cytochrome c-type biogenesis protein CcmF [Pseudoduganella flava]|uniref:Cytochrome c-type biogenesis protein CcmF n=1 Tax=Pseudoduganella flava TaxID=871742 RepID=A0A562PNW3_9BURK|nr:heme lyase CcmF/NrfE family subunit [Pseudoduganella flava]QGZ40661.1 heme lyase CcmF/NrfE family subunit [Pseudoduganella flava]TWI46114.1 cytochrome c-type biogenesis protein CcmF [Pseudoduganella flava]